MLRSFQTVEVGKVHIHLVPESIKVVKGVERLVQLHKMVTPW